MANRDFSGLTVGTRYEPNEDRVVVGAEINGGFVMFAAMKRGQFDALLAATTPAPAPAPPAPAAPAPPEPVSGQPPAPAA